MRISKHPQSACQSEVCALVDAVLDPDAAEWERAAAKFAAEIEASRIREERAAQRVATELERGAARKAAAEKAAADQAGAATDANPPTW
jgi:hypothetical protein